MIGSVALLAIGISALTPPSQTAGPGPDDETIFADKYGRASAIEFELDDAQLPIIEAQGWICSIKKGPNLAAYHRVREEYGRLLIKATAVLGREPEQKVWMSSCRKFRLDKFNKSVAKAEWHLRRADTLIRKEGGK